MQLPCIQCKGSNPRHYCGRSYCPIIAKSEARFKVKERVGKQDFSGSSPSPFVGRYGYPFVNVGVLSVEERDSWVYDAPRYWADSDYDIQRVAGLRSALINSRFQPSMFMNLMFGSPTQLNFERNIKTYCTLMPLMVNGVLLLSLNNCALKSSRMKPTLLN